MSQFYPSNTQLIEAISEFLKDEVSPLISDKAVAYRMKVAINALGILSRECEQASELNALEQDLLSGFVEDHKGDANAAVSKAIQEQQIDALNPQLISALKQISLKKMAIDNPRYSTYRALTGSDS
ncbi:hypothetical protein IB286_03615 [Spongiibacter sp. KMU-158]|uniref:DUF6285 domain-containing protein n=1 Tax=Spongiibacter pelagi TaxID=2760804 RepID=A0A927C0S4_9GAMM|nr:DUF6285 domain-containing protein [Spongiibacter pelagi]MBD2858083.1 hypothetical protein [Spongiibacter pelagi]